MRTLYETIMELCTEKNIKGAKLCSDVGISKGLLTDLKMGRRTGVSAVTAQKIASYFDVSVNYLLGNTDTKKDPTVTGEVDEELLEIAKLLKQLSPEALERELAYLRSLSSDSDK